MPETRDVATRSLPKLLTSGHLGIKSTHALPMRARLARGGRSQQQAISLLGPVTLPKLVATKRIRRIKPEFYTSPQKVWYWLDEVLAVKAERENFEPFNVACKRLGVNWRQGERLVRDKILTLQTGQISLPAGHLVIKRSDVDELLAKLAVKPVAIQDEESLIRPWGRKSALSLMNGLSAVPMRRLPKPIGGN